jgi:hypothetical protein
MAILTRSTLLVFAVTSLTMASDYLPLQAGNEWVYREASTGSSFKIRVGTPTLIGGNTYYRLTGYVSQPLWVRHEQDSLVYRDEEREVDKPLTSYTTVPGAWFDAPFRECEEEGQPDDRRSEFEGAAGVFSESLRIRYRSFGCADAGTQEEIFRDGVGMLRRTSQSIAGPRKFELVSARIGRMQLNADQGSAFRLNVRRKNPNEPFIIATLKLSLDTETALRVRKPLAQDFDLVVKNEAGQTVWAWSAGRVFPAAIEEVLIGPGDREYSVEVPVRLTGGAYVIEAWLTTGDDRIQFSAAAPFQLPPGE